MATYIPGMTDVFPGSSEYNPDWDRIERMLRLRQKMYDDGAQRVKNIYDSVFNSPMLRETDIKRRDEYLKTISESLNRVSAMDLSLPGNQSFASSLMLPVTEDENIVHDIAYTKKVQTERAKADSYKNSADGDTRRRYWPIGMKALQYRTEEYQKATDSQALGMSAPEYVPNIDMLPYAQKMFKESGISVTKDEKNGGYIWTRKNGDLALPITIAYVDSLLSADPGIKAMVETQAYVERKDFIKKNALDPAFGSEDAAERFYLEGILKNATKTISKQVDSDKQDASELRARVDSWENSIRKNGIIPGSEDHMKYLNDLEKLKAAEQGVEAGESVLSGTNTINFSNIEDARNQADALVAFSNYTLMRNDLARNLAAIDIQVKMREDKFDLTKLRMDLALRNSQTIEAIKHANKKEIEQMQIDAGKYKNKKEKEEEETPEDDTFNNLFFKDPFTNEDDENKEDSRSRIDWNKLGGNYNLNK